ncbi:MAG: MepB family protein [Pseudomonadota bacterium]
MDIDTTAASSGQLPCDLVSAIRHAYQAAGITVTSAARREAESAEYGACRLGLNGVVVVFRAARTTPTKIGQFVTLWKRPEPGAEIAPLDSGDGVDFVVVSVSDARQRGQFVYSREALIKHGVMSHGGKGGKRAIRVYPPWSKPVAAAAIKTQQWQLRYFLALTTDFGADPAQVRKLFKAREL